MNLSRSDYARRILLELKKVDKARRLGLVMKNPGMHWIRCPWHKQGRERTPSLRIQLKPASKYLGSFKCWGCNKIGYWPTLAEKMRCDPLTDRDGKPSIDNSEAVQLLDRDERNLFLETDQADEQILGLDWPSYQDWRNIRGEIIEQVGGKLFIDENFSVERLFLPCMIHGKYRGGVKCNITPVKHGGNYLNTRRFRTPELLLFHDYVQSELENFDFRVASLSEGPRDALNCSQHGLPGLGNLGAVSSWTKAKVPLILDLQLDCLILLFDGDEAGRAAADKAYEDLNNYVNVLDIEMPSKTVKDKFGKPVIKKTKDASDLSAEEIRRLIVRAWKKFGDGKQKWIA